MSEAFNEMMMLGIDGETYSKLLEVAKRENKSVVQVASEALKDKIEQASALKESTERKMLMEG